MIRMLSRFRFPCYFYRPELCRRPLERLLIAKQNSQGFHTTCITAYLKTFLETGNLHAAIQIDKLKSMWDPGFNHEQFMFGANQALLAVVPLIADQQWKELRGLLRRDLLENLSNDKDALEELKRFQSLNEAHLTSSHFENFLMQEIVDEKYCDVTVGYKIVGVFPHSKGTDSSTSLKLTETYFHLKFHRDYSEYKLPDWTIIGFNWNSSEQEE